MNRRVTIHNSKFIFIAVALFLVVAIIKLSYVNIATVVDGMNIEAFANSRNTVEKTLYADRGVIYDQNGEILAETVNSYTVIAFLEEERTEDEDDPRHVIDKAGTANALSIILGIEESVILESLNKDKYQVELDHNITELTKSKIDALDLPGIGFIESVSRYYQSGTFASYIVGYAKPSTDGEIIGELGIEGYYDDILSGINGETTYQKDAYGYKIANVPEYTTPAVSGDDIYLTIDSNIQLITENAINKLSKENEHEWAIFTVMDAETGAIVASSTSPTFNPNNLNTITSYLNPLVSYQYEPGSTMKTFSFASAIEESIYDGQEIFTSGNIEIDDATISDFNKIGWGDITFDKGYAYSSNVATSIIALELGVERLNHYYDSLGFGSKTDIELSGEVYGDIDFYYNTEIANAAFGQGMTTTPIQLLQAYTTMTNDGTMLKPYIVDKIVDENGEVTYQGGREEVEKVFSKSTTDYMNNLMYDAVYNGVSALWQPENVTIIGKTGTAQIADPSGGYLTGDSNVIRSFMSIFPQDDPKYIMYMAVSKYTGTTTTLSDITTTAIEEIASFAKITDEEINHKINDKVVLDNYISTKLSETLNKLEPLNINPIIIGDGNYITNQYPLKNTILFKDDKLFLKTNSSNIKMVDLTNYSLNDVNTICNLMDIKCNIKGSGYVISQTIPIDTIVNSDTILEVVLE